MSKFLKTAVDSNEGSPIHGLWGKIKELGLTWLTSASRMGLNPLVDGSSFSLYSLIVRGMVMRGCKIKFNQVAGRTSDAIGSWLLSPCTAGKGTSSAHGNLDCTSRWHNRNSHYSRHPFSQAYRACPDISESPVYKICLDLTRAGAKSWSSWMKFCKSLHEISGLCLERPVDIPRAVRIALRSAFLGWGTDASTEPWTLAWAVLSLPCRLLARCCMHSPFWWSPAEEFRWMMQQVPIAQALLDFDSKSPVYPYYYS